MTTSTTQGITVSVETQFLPGHSNPVGGHFVFGYQITIENGTEQTVQLLRRHWIITDANGEVREVEGEGVIGLQPVLAAGEAHTYTSYCELRTELGKMHGTYLMLRPADQSTFQVTIPEFRLTAPFILN